MYHKYDFMRHQLLKKQEFLGKTYIEKPAHNLKRGLLQLVVLQKFSICTRYWDGNGCMAATDCGQNIFCNTTLSTRMAWNIVRKWGEFTGVGKLSPHDLRRTAITKALDQGLSYRQVQMMSGHKDPKTVMRYDHGRENLEQNAVNFLQYDED
jgi:Phage integrase family